MQLYKCTILKLLLNLQCFGSHSAKCCNKEHVSLQHGAICSKQSVTINEQGHFSDPTWCIALNKLINVITIANATDDATKTMTPSKTVKQCAQ